MLTIWPQIRLSWRNGIYFNRMFIKKFVLRKQEDYNIQGPQASQLCQLLANLMSKVFGAFISN